ncbi:MAG: DUF4760 domain-containing protein [Treponema sp.]|nr:DUF4760 domain-containing protein [Treponema sp.]
MDNVYTITAIISHAAIISGVVIALIQLKADHERRKKQATIEFYQKIRKENTMLLKVINEIFTINQVINVDDVEGKDNQDILNIIKEYLFYMEMISVGINTNVYSDTIFERISGVSVTRSFYRFREIIYFLRRRSNNQAAYKDFEDLISKLKVIRKKRFYNPEFDLAIMKHDLG